MFTITDKLLAGYIERAPSTSGKYFFKSTDALPLRAAMRVIDQLVNDDHYVINIVEKNRIPYWLCAAIASALAPKAVSLLTPNSPHPILIPHIAIPLMGTGGTITFVRTESDDFTLVQFSSPRSLPNDQLDTIVPQYVNPERGVVISSAAPPWIIATVALAYGKMARWVAITQMKGNPVIVISRDKYVPIGTEVDPVKVAAAMQQSEATSAPRRGEIWLFDDGYGVHPGIIMSPDEDNRTSPDLMIIPTTTKPIHEPRHIVVVRTETGLDQDSYAAYAHMSRIGQDQLCSKAPIGNANQALMDKLGRLVNRSMGFVA